MENANHEAATAPSTLAMALIISSQAPVVLLDDDLNVVAASASFYRDFGIERSLCGRVRFADLGGGEWNVPQLLLLLRATAAGQPEIETYEMDLIRPAQPVCQLLVSAHKLDYGTETSATRVVLTISNVTDIRLAGKLQTELLHEKHVLMQELQHRVANSLQIIASVLLQSARKVNSEESRDHLEDAHHRVMSIATLQKQLATTQDGVVGLRNYFSELCESISASMIANASFLSLTTDIDDSKVDARISASLGLIVTELVINSLKHAFSSRTRAGKIVVSYRSEGAGWVLRVDDNGTGFDKDSADSRPGLGTGIVEALAGQLGATVAIGDAGPGTSVTITRE